MKEEQALQVIEQALQIANSKGSFKLEESATIFTALNVIKENAVKPKPELVTEIKKK